MDLHQWCILWDLAGLALLQRLLHKHCRPPFCFALYRAQFHGAATLLAQKFAMPENVLPSKQGLPTKMQCNVYQHSVVLR